MENFPLFKDTLLLSISGILSSVTIALLWRISSALMSIKVQIATIVNNNAWYEEKFNEHSERLDSHGDRISVHAQDIAILKSIPTRSR